VPGNIGTYAESEPIDYRSHEEADDLVIDARDKASITVHGPEPHSQLEEARTRHRCELLYCTSTIPDGKLGGHMGLKAPEVLDLSAIRPGGTGTLRQFVYQNWERKAVHYTHGHPNLFPARIGVTVRNKHYDANQVVFAERRSADLDPFHVGPNATFRLFIECPALETTSEDNLPRWLAVNDAIFRTPKKGWYVTRSPIGLRFTWRQPMRYGTQRLMGPEDSRAPMLNVFNLQLSAIWRVPWTIFMDNDEWAERGGPGLDVLMVHTAFLTHIGKGDPSRDPFGPPEKAKDFEDTGVPEDPDYRLMWEGAMFRSMPNPPAQWPDVYAERSDQDLWKSKFSETHYKMRDPEDIYVRDGNGQKTPTPFHSYLTPVENLRKRPNDKWFRLQFYKIRSGDGNYRFHEQIVHGAPITQTLVSVGFPYVERRGPQNLVSKDLADMNASSLDGAAGRIPGDEQLSPETSPLCLYIDPGGGRNAFGDAGMHSGFGPHSDIHLGLDSEPRRIVVQPAFRGSSGYFWPEWSELRKRYDPQEGDVLEDLVGGALSHYMPPFGSWVLGVDGPFSSDQCGGELKDVVACCLFAFRMARSRVEPDRHFDVVSGLDDEGQPADAPRTMLHADGDASLGGGSHGGIIGPYVLSKINGEYRGRLDYDDVPPIDENICFKRAFLVAGDAYYLKAHLYFHILPSDVATDPLTRVIGPVVYGLDRFGAQWAVSPMDNILPDGVDLRWPQPPFETAPARTPAAVSGKTSAGPTEYPTPGGGEEPPKNFRREDEKYVPTTRAAAEAYLKWIAWYEYQQFNLLGRDAAEVVEVDGEQKGCPCKDGSSYHRRMCPIVGNEMSQTDYTASIAVVSHLSELDREWNYYDNHSEDRHKFKGPPRGMDVLYFTTVAQDWITPPESTHIYVSKFWRSMNRGKQRLFLEAGTSLQYVLAHDNDRDVPPGAANDLQQFHLWALIVGAGVHWYPTAFSGAKAAMFAFGLTSALRLDQTVGRWDPGTSPLRPDGDRDWQAHQLLQVKPIPGDYDNEIFRRGNATHYNFRITVAHTVPVIEFKVREPGPSRIRTEKIDVRRVVTEIVSQIPEQLRMCEVCLRSQGENRANEPL